MPKARAYDGGHTVFTDHSIPRQPSTVPARRDDVSELVAYFDRVLPVSAARRNLGMAYASIGAVEKSWPMLRAAAETKPRDAALYAQMALLLEADGRLEQAIDLYRISLKIDPEQDTALTRLGTLLARRRSTVEAKRLLQKALLRNPRQSALKETLASLE